jgi:hypothetical protein
MEADGAVRYSTPLGLPVVPLCSERRRLALVQLGYS